MAKLNSMLEIKQLKYEKFNYRLLVYMTPGIKLLGDIQMIGLFCCLSIG